MDAVASVVGALLAALFVGLALRWPNGARALIAAVFVGGALFNLLVALPDAGPMLRGLVATSYLPFYRDVVAAAVSISAGGFLLLVVLFEATVAVSTLWRGPAAKLGLAGAALWCLAMLPVVPPHAWLGSTLALAAVAFSAVLLTRRDFGVGRPVGVARRPTAVSAVALVLLFALYAAVLHPWLLDWGSTPAERAMVLPGDREEDMAPGSWQPGTQRTGATPDQTRRFTRAITVAAPPVVVWSWLVQIGQDRAGFYSNDWLENLFGADIHNADEIKPEWQQRAAGDLVPMARPDILGGRLRDATKVSVTLLDPPRAIDGVTGRFVLLPTADGGTRLLLREPVDRSLASWLIGDPMHFVMEQRELRGIKERAEGRPLVPPLLFAAARLGWYAAAATVAALFASRRRWLPWAALALLPVLPSLAATGDVNGALAGFLAIGISLLGALRFGRRWLAPYALLAPGVLLVLLLAPDAYAAFGLAFDLCLLAAAWLLWRRRTERFGGQHAGLPGRGTILRGAGHLLFTAGNPLRKVRAGH
jgi:hypothetical protein